jgi:hypothetical protein
LPPRAPRRTSDSNIPTHYGYFQNAPRTPNLFCSTARVDGESELENREIVTSRRQGDRRKPKTDENTEHDWDYSPMCHPTSSTAIHGNTLNVRTAAPQPTSTADRRRTPCTTTPTPIAADRPAITATPKPPVRQPAYQILDEASARTSIAAWLTKRPKQTRRTM